MAQRSENEKALFARYRKRVKSGVIPPVKVNLVFVNKRGFVDYDPEIHPGELHQALKSGATVKEFCKR